MSSDTTPRRRGRGLRADRPMGPDSVSAARSATSGARGRTGSPCPAGLGAARSGSAPELAARFTRTQKGIFSCFPFFRWGAGGPTSPPAAAFPSLALPAAPGLVQRGRGREVDADLRGRGRDLAALRTARERSEERAPRDRVRLVRVRAIISTASIPAHFSRGRSPRRISRSPSCAARPSISVQEAARPGPRHDQPARETLSSSRCPTRRRQEAARRGWCWASRASASSTPMRSMSSPPGRGPPARHTRRRARVRARERYAPGESRGGAPIRGRARAAAPCPRTRRRWRGRPRDRSAARAGALALTACSARSATGSCRGARGQRGSAPPARGWQVPVAASRRPLRGLLSQTHQRDARLGGRAGRSRALDERLEVGDAACRPRSPRGLQESVALLHVAVRDPVGDPQSHGTSPPPRHRSRPASAARRLA